MNPTTIQLIEAIKLRLLSVEDSLATISRDGIWTQQIKGLLDDVALTFGLDSRHSETPDSTSPNSEFLCDVLWLKTESGERRQGQGYFVPGHRILKCVLACEIEWKMDEQELLYDFSKLLLLRSELALFIAQAKDLDVYGQLLSHFQEALDKYSDPIDTPFLVIIHLRKRSGASRLFQSSVIHQTRMPQVY